MCVCVNTKQLKNVKHVSRKRYVYISIIPFVSYLLLRLLTLFELFHVLIHLHYIQTAWGSVV